MAVQNVQTIGLQVFMRKEIYHAHLSDLKDASGRINMSMIFVYILEKPHTAALTKKNQVQQRESMSDIGY